jgi:hypothetical protein
MHKAVLPTAASTAEAATARAAAAASHHQRVKIFVCAPPGARNLADGKWSPPYVAHPWLVAGGGGSLVQSTR